MFTGEALNALVARAFGGKDAINDWIFYQNSPFGHAIIPKQAFTPLWDALLFLQLLSYLRIEITPMTPPDLRWRAKIEAFRQYPAAQQFGTTPMEAGCRAIVAQYLGEYLNVVIAPDEADEDGMTVEEFVLAALGDFDELEDEPDAD